MSVATAPRTDCGVCGAIMVGNFCSNCGAAAGQATDDTGTTPHDQIGSKADIIKLLGAEQFLLVLRNAFRPIRHIKECASQPAVRLSAFLLSFIEFGAIIGVFNQYILKGAVDHLGFPWSFTDRHDELGIVAVIIGVALNAFALFVFYLLPDRLFDPVGKTRALCLYFVVLMYSALFYTLTSGAFIFYWIAVQDADTLAALRMVRTVAIMAFALFAIRFGIGLSWGRAVAVMVLGMVLTFVTAAVYFATGIWQLA